MESPEPKLVPDYPRDKWSVLGYVLVHPRTWCLILGLAFAWQCGGVKELYRHHVSIRLESEAIAAHH